MPEITCIYPNLSIEVASYKFFFIRHAQKKYVLTVKLKAGEKKEQLVHSLVPILTLTKYWEPAINYQ